jgi:D-arabinose 1-dehydrogenase-like Zn-dependent alcohol dehydrogenase
LTADRKSPFFVDRQEMEIVMLAAVVDELEKPLLVRSIPDPECPSDGAIVRIGANGICRTDWHL